VSQLLAEIGLRLVKVVVAGILGLLIYLVMTGPLGATPSPELALLAWLSGAAALLLVESSPI
jgi:hypothetical protein